MADVENLILTPGDVAAQLLKEVGQGKDGKIRLWDHTPVNIVQFVEDPYYYNLKNVCRQNVMDDLVNLFGTNPYDVSPKFKYANFSEAVGTGKTYRMSIAAGFMTQKLLCLRNPIKYFNDTSIEGDPQLSENTKIAIVLCAVTADNARKVVFTETGNKIMGCRWFRDFYPPNKKVQSELQFDPLPLDYTKISNRVYKNVFIIPGSSSEYSAVGYSVILSVIDEVTLFEDIKDKSLVGGADRNDQAEVIYNVLDSRIESRFGGRGLLMTSGNPKHTEDFLERHIADTTGSPDTLNISRRALWHSVMPDFDPTIKLSNGEAKYPHFYFHLERLTTVPESLRNRPGVIPIPMRYYDKFQRNPEAAKRDLAGYPTSAVGRVIVNPNLVFDGVNSDRIIPVDPNQLRPYPPATYLDPNFRRMHMAWHAIHIDMGQVKDAAAFCLTHPYGKDDIGEPLIYTDLILRLQGSHDDPVNPDDVMNWILYLRDVLKFPIAKITADRALSSYLLLRLKARGFNVAVLSVDMSNDPYNELIQTIRTGRNDYYNHSIAIQELQQLERKKGKYEHRRNFHKDCSDSWAGSTYNSIRLAPRTPPPENWDEVCKLASRATII